MTPPGGRSQGERRFQRPISHPFVRVNVAQIRFPATVPPVFIKTYLQAHRLDTAFYDHHFGPGAYLRTHADHDRNWG